MPTPNPTLRREYKGAAAGTTLQNSMLSTDTTFVLVSANNWPTGAVGKFVVTVNRGQADEEKILCDSQSSRNVSCLLANRGFDGTTAQSHAAGATVECTISAFDADEWNQHTNATTGVHGAAGAVVGTTDTQTLTNKTLTDPTINFGGQSISGAWTSYTPVWTAATTNPTIGNGAIHGFYKQIGKTVDFRICITIGSTTTLGSGLNYAFNTPTLANVSSGPQVFGSAMLTGPGGNAGGWTAWTDGTTNGGTSTILVHQPTIPLAPNNSFLVTSATIAIAGTYEAA